MKMLVTILALAITLMGMSTLASALDNTADLSLAVGEQYNDNLFLTHSNREHDYITQISPALALTSKTQTINIAVSYLPTFNIYSQHSDIDYISHAATLRSLFTLSERFNLQITDTFVQSKNPQTINQVAALAPPTLTAPVITGPIVRGLDRITTNTLTGDLSYKISPKVTLDVMADYTLVDDAQAPSGDGNTYTGGLGASYLLTDRTTLRANAKDTIYRYRTGSDGANQTYTLGVNHRFTPTLTADVYGGLVVTRIYQPGNTEYGGAGGVLLNKVFEWGTTSISYRRDVISSYQSNAPMTGDVVRLSYSLPVMSTLTGSLNGWYGRYKSITGVPSSSVQTNREDYGGSAEAIYQLLPWANLNLSYSYIMSNDKLLSDGGYVNNIIMLTFKVAKQVKF